MSVEAQGNNNKTDRSILRQSDPPPLDDVVDEDSMNSSPVADTSTVVVLSWNKKHKNIVVPLQYKMFNVGVLQTSICGHHGQSKCYFKGSQMVVCLCSN